MAMSEKTRTTIYQRLSPLIDEEAIGEMLSYFPVRDGDEPVTKEHLDRRFAEIQAQFAGVDAKFAGIDARFEKLRGEMTTGLAAVETKIEAQATRLIAVVGLAATILIAVMVGVVPRLIP